MQTHATGSVEHSGMAMPAPYPVTRSKLLTAFMQRPISNSGTILRQERLSGSAGTPTRQVGYSSFARLAAAFETLALGPVANELKPSPNLTSYNRICLYGIPKLMTLTDGSLRIRTFLLAESASTLSLHGLLLGRRFLYRISNPSADKWKTRLSRRFLKSKEAPHDSSTLVVIYFSPFSSLYPLSAIFFHTRTAENAESKRSQRQP